MYTIKHPKRINNLNSFFDNSNGKIGDILQFSNSCWMIFSTKNEAEQKIQYIQNTLKNQSHYIDGLKEKLISFSKALYASEY